MKTRTTSMKWTIVVEGTTMAEYEKAMSVLKKKTYKETKLDTTTKAGKRNYSKKYYWDNREKILKQKRARKHTKKGKSALEKKREYMREYMRKYNKRAVTKNEKTRRTSRQKAK